VIQKSGSWFSYNGERIGQGRENTRLFLKGNPELTNDLETKIRNSMKDVHLFDIGNDEEISAEIG
jgi:recombination protein RecA